jgi:hypothetical protein
MSNIKYFAIAGQGEPAVIPITPKGALVNSVWMDGSVVDGCMFSETSWCIKPFKREGLWKHNSDEVIFFIGGNPDDPENLNARIEM